MLQVVALLVFVLFLLCFVLRVVYHSIGFLEICWVSSFDEPVYCSIIYCVYRVLNHSKEVVEGNEAIMCGRAH